MLRRGDISRGIAVVTFDAWEEANRFRDQRNGSMWDGKRIVVKWEREAMGGLKAGVREGGVALNLNSDERNTIMIAGLVEGGSKSYEEELAMQEEVIRRSMDRKNLRTWGLVKWDIKWMKRVGRINKNTNRLLRVCVNSREGADYIYHRRNKGRGERVRIMRYKTREIIEREKWLKNMRQKRARFSLQMRQRMGGAAEMTVAKKAPEMTIAEKTPSYIPNRYNFIATPTHTMKPIETKHVSRETQIFTFPRTETKETGKNRPIFKFPISKKAKIGNDGPIFTFPIIETATKKDTKEP